MLTHKLVRTLLLFAPISACGVISTPQASDGSTVYSTFNESDRSDWGDGNSILSRATVTSFSCKTCWVRCTNAAPEACRWTRAYNLSEHANCGVYADSWCSHKDYKHSWAGCTASKTEYRIKGKRVCCCDPDGLCSKC